MLKILYLPTADNVETPDWLVNTKEAFINFINDPEIRFYICNYSSLRGDSHSKKLRWISLNPEACYVRWGTEIEKYHLEVVEVGDV